MSPIPGFKRSGLENVSIGVESGFGADHLMALPLDVVAAGGGVAFVHRHVKNESRHRA